MAQRHFICAKDTYQSQGEQKSRFNRIGELVTIDGSNGTFQRIRLYTHPGQEFHLFEDDRGGNGGQQAPQQQPQQAGLPQQQPAGLPQAPGLPPLPGPPR